MMVEGGTIWAKGCDVGVGMAEEGVGYRGLYAYRLANVRQRCHYSVV